MLVDDIGLVDRFVGLRHYRLPVLLRGAVNVNRYNLAARCIQCCIEVKFSFFVAQYMVCRIGCVKQLDDSGLRPEFLIVEPVNGVSPVPDS
ncbi:MAG: hypothetical protein DDT20_01229 [Firmicutes bacterium]|nr:hypothetical protein [Bacillota bacterium]